MINWPDLIFPPINLDNVPYQCITVKSENRTTNSIPVKHICINWDLHKAILSNHGGKPVDTH